MGLFSSKKTYVSSTLYNMAGPIEDRPNFLKTLMVGNALGVSDRSLPEKIRMAYSTGPGSRLRNFARWAKDNYGVVGVARGNLYSRIEVSSDAVAAQIIHDPDTQVSIQRVEAKLGDYAYWAEQWMMEHEPELLGSNWTSDFDETRNEVTIRFADGGSVAFTPAGFRKTSAYIFAVYTIVRGNETGEVIPGPVQDLGDAAFPDVAGWNQKSTTSKQMPVSLAKFTKTVVSYSDGRPDETTTVINDPTETSYEYYRAVYDKYEYEGAQPGNTVRLTGVRQVMNLARDGKTEERVTTDTQSNVMSDGVTKTVTTTVTENTLKLVRSVRYDTQDVTLQSTSTPKMFIYRLGSGNPTLDKLVSQQPDDGFYFPFIPLRLDNKMLPQVSQPAYDASVKAYKKATSGSLDSLIDSLQGNKDLKDIDYAYVMFGVSLNTKENTGRKYLFDFFEKLRLSQQTDRDDYAIWAAQQREFDANSSAANDWAQAQYDPNSDDYGMVGPSLGSTSAMPVSEIRIRGNGSLPTNMDIQITWQSITKASGTGLGKPGAKQGDCWVTTGASDTFGQDLLVGSTKLKMAALGADRVNIYRQVSATKFEVLTIIGLVHKNFIYKGKFVEISGKEALADNEESGFLVPLHYDTYKEMGTVDATQLASACCYMVINSYLVKKTGFFGSTFFKILLVVAVVAITVATGGTAAPGGVGLLGSSAAVGAAIGLTGTLAIIAGAVANAIVAMIVTKLISAGAIAIFGDKLGAIIGAIASIVTLQVGTSFATGSSLAASFSSLARAENIIALTSSVGNGVAGYIRAGAQDTMLKTQKLQDDYETRSKEISDQAEREFGYGRGIIDPLSLTQGGQFALEGPGSFLERTLMTGSDVAEMSLSLLSNFADITLSTELPL